MSSIWSLITGGTANCRGFRSTPIRHCLNNINKGVVFQVLTALVATLMAFSDGMSMGWTSPMIPYFISEDSYLKMTQHEAEELETWFLVGAVIGVPFTGYLVNKIGRKKSLLLSSCLLIIAWVIIALVKNLEVIYFARALSGFGGNMAFVAAPCYVSEIAEQKIRGFLSSIIFLMLLIGVLIVYTVSPPHVPYYVSPVIGICLLTVEIIVFSLLPESPYYLLYNDQKEAAKKSLKFFRSSGLWEQELNEITIAIERQKNSEKGGLKDIWKVKSYRKSFLIMTLLNMAQQFGAIDVILMNMHQMLEEAGSIYLQPTSTATLFAVIMFVAGAIASGTVDKFGRKKLMYISSILTSLCLLIIAIYFQIKNSGYEYEKFSWLPLVSVMIYAFVFKYGMGMVPVIVTGEIFAAKIKEMGVALVDGVYVVGTIIAIQLYLFLKDQFGMQVPFYIFSCCSFLTCILVKFYMPETKGRTLDEIQLILEGKST